MVHKHNNLPQNSLITPRGATEFSQSIIFATEVCEQSDLERVWSREFSSGSSLAFCNPFFPLLWRKVDCEIPPPGAFSRGATVVEPPHPPIASHVTSCVVPQSPAGSASSLSRLVGTRHMLDKHQLHACA